MSESKNLQKPEGVVLVYTSCTQRCSTSSLKLTEEELEALNALRSQSRIPYNKDNQAHQSLLKQFWSTLFPTEDPPGDLKSDKWKQIGFQNKDPASDFRGAGVFGLEQLLYIASNYPQEFSDITQNSSTYSFAISALNITVIPIQHVLMCFFQLHKKTAVGIPGAKVQDIQVMKTFCILNRTNLDTVNELFVGAVVRMHKTWMEMNKKGNLNLMQFQPAILAAADYIEKIMKSGPKNVMELKQRLFL